MIRFHAYTENCYSSSKQTIMFSENQVTSLITLKFYVGDLLRPWWCWWDLSLLMKIRPGSVFFNGGRRILSFTHCARNFTQSGIHRELCWKTSFTAHWTSSFSGMRFTIWRASLTWPEVHLHVRPSNFTVTRWILILTDNRKMYRAQRKLLRQIIVPRIYL